MIEEEYNYKRQDYNDEIDYDSQKLAELKREYEETLVYAQMSGKVIDIKADLEGSIAKKDDVIMSIVDNDNGLFVIEDMNAAGYFSEPTVSDTRSRYFRNCCCDYRSEEERVKNS